MREQVYTVRSIVAAAEKAGQIPAGTITGRCQRRPTQIWRVAVYRVAMASEHSRSHVGREICRDQTTVMSALNRWKRCPRQERDAVAQAVEAIELVLRNEHTTVEAPALRRARSMALRFEAKSIRKAEQARKRFENRQEGIRRAAIEARRSGLVNVEVCTQRMQLEAASNRLLTRLRQHHGDMIGGAA